MCRRRGAHRRHQVDAEAALPGVSCLEDPGGVVDQDVDAAERAGGLFDIAVDRRRLRQVTRRGVGDAGLLGQFGARGGQGLGAARADRDPGALGGEGQGDRPADAAAAAGHHHAHIPQTKIHDSGSRL